ncbi:uncharacterized protein LOC62_02G003043 [Vanrija pseudolonga]|uniref:Uncharacterized protein n=1 Tax=Vanrija pseudolonga TaxID=143232 RepID=A0AAF0Y7U7_9TREE|nr:hypothetical protein LOC62_02G003043 [Vanrija pseudolonga]
MITHSSSSEAESSPRRSPSPGPSSPSILGLSSPDLADEFELLSVSTRRDSLSSTGTADSFVPVLPVPPASRRSSTSSAGTEEYEIIVLAPTGEVEDDLPDSTSDAYRSAVESLLDDDDDDDDADEVATVSGSSLSRGTSTGRRMVARRRDTDGEYDDDLDAWSDRSAAATERSSGRTITGAGSVTSASEARESIDNFFEDSTAFMSDKANKLRLWQALCIELGLVDIDEEPMALPDLPSSAPPAPPAPRTPLPTSLTQARLLLKKHGHVNLVDYIAARSDPARAEIADRAGKYADLMHPSASAMIRDAKKHHRILKLCTAKSEWLEPLLKDFGYRHAARGH